MTSILYHSVLASFSSLSSTSLCYLILMKPIHHDFIDLSIFILYNIIFALRVFYFTKEKLCVLLNFYLKKSQDEESTLNEGKTIIWSTLKCTQLLLFIIFLDCWFIFLKNRVKDGRRLVCPCPINVVFQLLFAGICEMRKWIVDW